MKQKRHIQVLVPLRLNWTPTYLLQSDMQVEKGSLVKVNFAGRVYRAVVLKTDCPAPPDEEKIKYIEEVEALPPVSDSELKLWEFIADYYLCSLGEVFKNAYSPSRLPSTKKRKTAAKKNSDEAEGQEQSSRETKLTKAQTLAIGAIRQAFADDKPALIDGVTGSGKTELYITLAKEQLAQGRNALVLVPEIALSSQLEERLRAYFGPVLHTYHSALTPRQKANVAEAVREGKYVVLGTRSSIFLPFKDLGLVVVDEEHDNAYKQETAPRYNGRDCAAVLAKIHGAKLLLGSATPSLESIYNCLAGKYRRVSLKERYFGSEAARAEIIDISAERRKNGMVGNLSRKLIAHIKKALDDGGQVIVLRARRAYSTSMQCTSCGTIVKCPKCNVPMSYHKDTDRLVCHYCGRVVSTHECPSCHGQLQGIGAGTQKIEEELKNVFPQASVARLDGDTTPAARQKITEDFAGGAIDILIGTQMLTKGFDFKGVKLVAAIGADGLLGLLDFRADEKAVQVLSQLRGRTGRREEKGVFVIQTAQGEHPVYNMLRGDGSPEEFETKMLEQRRDFSYPPYTRITDLVMQDSSEQKVDNLSFLLSRKLSGMGFTSLLGPYPPQVDKVGGKFIRIIRVTLKRDSSLQQLKSRLQAAVQAFEADFKWAGHITVDVDPQ